MECALHDDAVDLVFGLPMCINVHVDDCKEIRWRYCRGLPLCHRLLSHPSLSIVAVPHIFLPRCPTFSVKGLWGSDLDESVCLRVLEAVLAESNMGPLKVRVETSLGILTANATISTAKTPFDTWGTRVFAVFGVGKVQFAQCDQHCWATTVTC